MTLLLVLRTIYFAYWIPIAPLIAVSNNNKRILVSIDYLPKALQVTNNRGQNKIEIPNH